MSSSKKQVPAVAKQKELEKERRFQLRLCHRSDLPLVARIEEACFPGEPVLPLLTLVQYFDLFESTFIVAEDEGKLIGFGIGGRQGDNSKVGWLLDGCVLSEYQKQGVGKSIGAWLIKALQQQGCEYVRATVSPHNIPSQKLLHGCGFKTVQNVPDYFGPGEDRLIVELDLMRPERPG